MKEQSKGLWLFILMAIVLAGCTNEKQELTNGVYYVKGNISGEGAIAGQHERPVFILFVSDLAYLIDVAFPGAYIEGALRESRVVFNHKDRGGELKIIVDPQLTASFHAVRYKGRRSPQSEEFIGDDLTLTLYARLNKDCGEAFAQMIIDDKKRPTSKKTAAERRKVFDRLCLSDFPKEITDCYWAKNSGKRALYKCIKNAIPFREPAALWRM